MRTSLKVVGLFAGVGGFELGFAKAGHETTTLVERWAPACAVLRARFPEARVLEVDVERLDTLPRDTDVLTAGFPCQDLSSVGLKDGIAGRKSGVVSHVFRLLRKQPVRWVILENVPFLLDLERGKAVEYLTTSLTRMGYSWAYRVIDAEAFGLPQRRRRLVLVASQDGDPRNVLLTRSMSRPSPPVDHRTYACGFYWTEGTRALGWAVDATPPVKGGSAVGVPSPPAIAMPDGSIVTPSIRDSERLQGFDEDWTVPAETLVRPGFRWTLVGNAVSVPVAAWVGKQLLTRRIYDASQDRPLANGDRWPKAAWAIGKGPIHSSPVTPWPEWAPRLHLADFLSEPRRPLSRQATRGFLGRAERGSLRFADGFIDQVRRHGEVMAQLERRGAA